MIELPLQILALCPEWVACVKPVGVDSEKELPSLLSENVEGTFFVVHRLDRNVGGVMVLARTAAAAAELSRLMQQGRFTKEYLALCHGCPPAEGRLEDLLWKDARRNKVFVVRRLRKGVRSAVLSYQVIRRGKEENDPTLLRVCLETGRSHQIRVQFASRGFPLLGDHLYGAKDDLKAPQLFAWRLIFPWHGREVSLQAVPPFARENSAEYI